MNDKTTKAMTLALEALEYDGLLKKRQAITALRAVLAKSERDWSMLEATQESLREHMAEIHRLRAAHGITEPAHA
jgi:hypothetical protein